MSDSIFSVRTGLAVLGFAAIGFFVYQSVEFGGPNKIQPIRPVGTVEDIEALANRDDVNVLFLLVDTLRASRMSVYGYERDTTPFMRAVADTGIVFGHNVAQSSWTKSSMASIWSGLNPLRAGITKFDHTLSDELELPAEILKDAGFMNVAMYRNGWVHGYFGFDQGFDKYYRPMGQRPDAQKSRQNPNALPHNTDEAMMVETKEFLRIHGQSERWFLYVHLMDLHEYVYDEESAIFGTRTTDLYDNSIRRIDWLVSTAFESLHEFDLLDETIVVILSDHGEAFGERGFDGHAREVLPETTVTPLLISLPFTIDGGIVVNTPTSNTDVWPTLLDLLGLPTPGGDIDGRSRRPEILRAARGAKGGEATPVDSPADDSAEPDTIFSYLDQNWGQNIVTVQPAISVVQGDYRYVSGLRANGLPFEALFLTADSAGPNVILEHPDVAERLSTLAEAHLETKADFEIESVEMDEMQLDQLRALGYDLH